MKLDGSTYLWILAFCVAITLIWLALWLNRKRFLRRICRGRIDEGWTRSQVGQILTQARQQRLINHQDELLLREELKLEG
jgi:hypothetical protein